MKKNFAISAFAILFLWLIWIVAYFAVGNDYLLPSFWETFASMGRLLGGKAFWVAFGASLLRTLLAFAVSFLFGVTFAVIARCFSPVRAFFAPIVSFLRTVPTLADRAVRRARARRHARAVPRRICGGACELR